MILKKIIYSLLASSSSQDSTTGSVAVIGNWRWLVFVSGFVLMLSGLVLSSLVLSSLVTPAYAGGAEEDAGVYQKPNDFLNEVFAGEVPDPQLLWLTGDRKQQVTDILAHKPNFLRIRYWQQGDKTAWIIDEIGKDKPITTGIVIDQQQIERLKVLVFRESRGWEVKYPFFSEQFVNAKLSAATDNVELTADIDNISGATLSVRAVHKVARLALLFDRWIRS